MDPTATAHTHTQFSPLENRRRAIGFSTCSLCLFRDYFRLFMFAACHTRAHIWCRHPFCVLYDSHRSACNWCASKSTQPKWCDRFLFARFWFCPCIGDVVAWVKLLFGWKRVTATAASRRSCLPFEKCWCGSNWIGHCFPSKAKMAMANATLRAYAIRFCSFRFVRQFILCIPLNKARRRLKASEKFSACRIVCARSCKISFPKCVCVWESFECTQTLSFMCRFGVDSISDKNKLYT